MSQPELLLAAHPCSECLTTRRRIVSGERAAQLLRECKAEGTHFTCHKGSIAHLNLHCRGVHDRLGSTAHRFAVAVGIPVREVDPDQLD